MQPKVYIVQSTEGYTLVVNMRNKGEWREDGGGRQKLEKKKKQNNNKKDFPIMV